MANKVNWETINTCVYCGAKFPANIHYYEFHGVRMEKYFMSNFPKQSLKNHETLKFKNIESYYFQDFATRKDMQDYVKSISLEEQKKYCELLMRRRAEIKQGMFLPSQVETLSLMMPSAKFYHKIFGDYYKFGQSLALPSRFRKLSPTDTLLTPDKIEGIQIDTREQLVLKFKGFRREVGKLNYGDYQLINSQYGNAVIERKGLVDFISSFGSGCDRLKREFDRAKADGAYVYVLIEEHIHNALRFNSLPYVSKKIKVTPDFVFKNVRDIMQSYDNVQFLFLPNREEMERWIPSILVNHNIFREIDLQLYFDSIG